MSFHELVLLFTVFVLAVFLGFELISKVPPTLHTPLMSGSNAISGITLVGSIVSAGSELDANVLIFGFETSISALLGFIAIFLATINVVGGYLVTDRMTRMFKKKE
ncbi:MAG: NAD(P) transhydrogenase subunit alpha [Leptospiraceae bacterium]|nr:NAD(P) transhydrogenase subunit alpha [Leptospiraceae bacterium]MDW7976870.1 NAD(P) transhydrogenase subunit alpha [Leptospiraceae bacterium]